MPDRALTFGRYCLDPRVGLTSGAREIKLTPKALTLLSFLAQRSGEVVSKDELFAAVWPETTVGDAALVTCIQELRSALKDDARKPRYIQTLHRRGYRFIARPARSAEPKDQANGTAAALSLPNKPSIAVLPFTNMSGDADQDYFAEGISEDLITGAGPHPLALCHRPQLELCLQEPLRGRERGLARARGALRARR